MINTIASGVSGAIELNKKGRKEHPCVYMTVADVESARELMETQVWARNYADNVIAAADEAMAKSDGWYLICKTDWGTWGMRGARGIYPDVLPAITAMYCRMPNIRIRAKAI
jgi:hypothetical protein